MPIDDDAMRRAMLAFGFACQAERDRRSLAALACADREFDATASPLRRAADTAAARAIAAAQRPPGER